MVRMLMLGLLFCSSCFFSPQAAASLEAIGGYDVETMGKPLDPLHLAKYIPAEKLRKYETVHCRVAMLACVGYAFPRELYLITHKHSSVTMGGLQSSEGGYCCVWWLRDG